LKKACYVKGLYLELNFDDIDGQCGDSLIEPSQKHVDEIKQFAANIIKARGICYMNIMIHCHAGVSRSTAAGIILLTEFNHTFEKAEEEIQKIRPQSNPNEKLLSLANPNHVWR